MQIFPSRYTQVTFDRLIFLRALSRLKRDHSSVLCLILHPLCCGDTQSTFDRLICLSTPQASDASTIHFYASSFIHSTKSTCNSTLDCPIVNLSMRLHTIWKGQTRTYVFSSQSQVEYLPSSAIVACKNKR